MEESVVDAKYTYYSYLFRKHSAKDMYFGMLNVYTTQY